MDRSGLCHGAAFSLGTPTVLTIDELVSFLDAVKKQAGLKPGGQIFVLSIVLKANMNMGPMTPEAFRELLGVLEEGDGDAKGRT